MFLPSKILPKTLPLSTGIEHCQEIHCNFWQETEVFGLSKHVPKAQGEHVYEALDNMGMKPLVKWL